MTYRPRSKALPCAGSSDSDPTAFIHVLQKLFATFWGDQSYVVIGYSVAIDAEFIFMLLI